MCSHLCIDVSKSWLCDTQVLGEAQREGKNRFWCQRLPCKKRQGIYSTSFPLSQGGIKKRKKKEKRKVSCQDTGRRNEEFRDTKCGVGEIKSNSCSSETREEQIYGGGEHKQMFRQTRTMFIPLPTLFTLQLAATACSAPPSRRASLRSSSRHRMCALTSSPPPQALHFRPVPLGDRAIPAPILKAPCFPRELQILGSPSNRSYRAVGAKWALLRR